MAELNLYAIGARIAQYRKRDRLRQYELAQRTGLHPVTISRIERGQLLGLTVAVLWRIAAALKVPVAYLWRRGMTTQDCDTTPRAPRAWSARLKKNQGI